MAKLNQTLKHKANLDARKLILNVSNYFTHDVDQLCQMN